MRYLFILFFVALNASHATESKRILEIKSGGLIPPDPQIVTTARIYSDGKIELVRLGGETASVGTLDPKVAQKLFKFSQEVPDLPLAEVNPNEKPNPSGFVFEYRVYQANGRTFLFAKDFSGKRYEILGYRTYTLKKMLDGILILARFGT